MAAPAFESAGAYLASSGAGASIAAPAGTAAGKVVVVGMYLDGDVLAVTPPDGFQAAPFSPASIPSGAGGHSLHVWWKRLTGADAGPYVFAWTGSRYREAQALLFTDVVATGDAFESGADTSTDTANSTTTLPVDITTQGVDRRLVWGGTNWSGGTWTAPPSPAGFVKRVQGGAGLFTLCDAAFATAGNTGNVTGSCTGSNKRTAWIGALIGTTPAAAPVVTGSATLTAGTALVAAGTRAVRSGTVTLTATTTLVAAGRRVVHSGAVVLAGGTTLVATGTRVVRSGPIALTMASHLGVSIGGAVPSGPVVLSAASSLTVSGRRVLHSGPVALTASAGLVAVGDRVVHATAGLAQAATVSAHGVVLVRTGVVLGAAGVLTITGVVLQAPVRLEAAASLAVSARVLVRARTVLSASGSLDVISTSGPQDFTGRVQGFVRPEGAATSLVGEIA